MKPLTPTPYELGREAADKQEAALVKQAIADRTADKQRIRELEAALRAIEKTARYAERNVRSLITARYDLGEIADHAAAILKGAK